MDDLSMINVDVDWREEQMFVRCMRTDCRWEDEIEPTASASIPALIERAQQHVRESHTDAMARARLANGGRGEVNAAPGKFARAADVVKVRDLDMTDAELAEFKARLRASITDGAVFTQRDVDPLGRGVGGDAGQHAARTTYPCPTHGAAGICRPSGGACVVDAPPIEGYDYANAWEPRRSDPRKRDENTLRSENP